MSKWLRIALVCFAVVLAAAVTRAPLQAQQDANALPTAAASPDGLPPGPGRDIFAATCSQCHALSVITHIRWDKAAWRHQVYDMVQRGAQVSPAEMDTLVTYLATNFGPGIPFPGQTPSHAVWPPGAGSDLVASRCIICHSAERVTTAHRSHGQWNAVVAKMVFFGAPLDADQIKTVVTYLNTNYGTGH
jgi:mono/diheme cytochrome c family protein